jgi:MFS transporter, ACS family, hexuronate transporter
MSNATQKIGNYRWTIVSLLLFATTVNYMDRNVIGFLKDYFCSKEGFGWTPDMYANLTSFFTAFYAGFTLVAGWVIDKVGTKIGLAGSLVLWSIAGMLSAFMGKGLPAHIAARSLFGMGEAGNFPASNKTIAEWFPKKERALAVGIFNSGSNLGAMICALIVPWFLLLWPAGKEFMGQFGGWQMAFLVTGLVGFIWLIFWGISYMTPKRALERGILKQTEFDHIHSDPIEVSTADIDPETGKAAKVPWFKMLTYKQTWAFVVGKFLTDGIWWFLLFWLPTYVKQQFCEGLDKATTAEYVMISNFIVFGVAIIGSVYGGSIPMSFINKGWATYKARMTAMLLIACAPLVLLTTQWFAGNYGIVAAIAVICIGGAAHQAWSANLFTTVSDMFPKKAVGTVTGIGAAAGGLGGVLVQKLAGALDGSATLSTTTAYGIMFSMCAFAYLIAWAIMKWLVPQHKPITDL